MIKELFNTIFFEPLYNALVILIEIVPGADVGIAVILLTIIVKILLFPLSIKMVRSQLQTKLIQKPLEEIKIKYKNNREELGKAMFELYKKHNINPFSGFILILIQIPVIFALYWVFVKGGFPEINTDILYSFVSIPDMVSMNFLGFINVGQAHNIILALLVGVSQYFQAKLSFPKVEARDKDKPASFQDDMMRGMQVQIKYVLPVIITFSSYILIAVVSLYWIVSNLFAIGQELYIRQTIKKPAEAQEKLDAEKLL